MEDYYVIMAYVSTAPNNIFDDPHQIVRSEQLLLNSRPWMIYKHPPADAQTGADPLPTPTISYTRNCRQYLIQSDQSTADPSSTYYTGVQITSK